MPDVSPPKADLALPGELLAELLSLVGEINAVLDPDELFPTIARCVGRLVDYQILEILLPDEEDVLVPAYVDGYDMETAVRGRPKVGEGISGAAAVSREPVFVPDVSQDPRYVPVFPGVVAELAIPLVHQDHLVGVLNIEGPDAEAFNPGARTALRILAGHLAVAIDNATLYREARWYAGLLATLYEIGKEAASILDLDELLRRVAELVKRVIDYEMFGILLLDEDEQELVLRQAVNFGPGKEKSRLPVSEGLCGAAVRSKEPVLVGDVRTDPRYVSLVKETRSELAIPLVHKDKVVGVFDLESPELDRFTERHVKVLMPLASQVAGAIANAELYERVRHNELRLGRELRIAQDVQRALFPETSPAGPGWEASAHFRPARELGGDLYDFYEMEEGRLGVATGDVSGKGAPAALYAAFASGTVRRRAREGKGPADLLGRVNGTLRHRGIEGLYCTLAYALFDFAGRSVRVANSGLPYPLHYRAGRGRAEPLTVSGLPLGTFDNVEYDELSVELAPGDGFLFFSDGITEALRGHEEYGVKRLRRGLETHGALSARALGEALMADLERFVGSRALTDDATLVVVKVL
ncbi:MAG: GAF domain-containing protein [Acidobacteria bacterium]|nr:GAF domain-containing protein [Acidobacteriota bacterium]